MNLGRLKKILIVCSWMLLSACASTRKHSWAKTDAVPSFRKGSNFRSFASTSGGSTRVPLSGDTQSYKVKKGDTLMKIAFESSGDVYRWKEIYEANRDKISDPNGLKRGTVLQVVFVRSGGPQDGEKYLIQKGDTLGKISSNLYGTPRKWRELQQKNSELIQDPNRIFAGFYLYYTPDPNARPLARVDDGTGQVGAVGDAGAVAETPQLPSLPMIAAGAALPSVPVLPESGAAPLNPH